MHYADKTDKNPPKQQEYHNALPENSVPPTLLVVSKQAKYSCARANPIFISSFEYPIAHPIEIIFIQVAHDIRFDSITPPSEPIPVRSYSCSPLLAIQAPNFKT
jgi:hypothetical protein